MDMKLSGPTFEGEFHNISLRSQKSKIVTLEPGGLSPPYIIRTPKVYYGLDASYPA